MQSPQLSVILCVYNQAHWAKRVLTSAAAQDLDVTFEVLVCDDGSSDGIWEAVREISAQSAIDIRYIWQPDQGNRLSRSRNNAIRCAQGKVLVFVDGDTWLTPTFLREHVNAHRKPGRLVCGMRSTIVLPAAANPATVPLPAGILEFPQPESLKQQQWLSTNRPWMACLGGNFSVPNLPEVRFDERIESWGSEDRDLAFRLFQAGFQPWLLPHPNAVQMRLEGEHWSQMTHTKVIALLHSKLYLAEKYPNGEMEPSLSLVRRCHLIDGRWSIGPLRDDVSVADVFDEFQRWRDEADSVVETAPQPTQQEHKGPGQRGHTWVPSDDPEAHFTRR